MPWKNVQFGIGESTHALEQTTFVKNGLFTRNLLEALFRDCGIARKIITRMPFDATRAGWSRFEGLDEKLSRELLIEEQRLGARAALLQALIWERLFGGAAIVLDIDDGLDPWEPLNQDQVREIRAIYPAHRWELYPYNYEGLNYSVPETYQISRDCGEQAVIVHKTRMLIFSGETSSDRARIENMSWGDPLLESIWEELRSAGLSDVGVIDYLLQLSVPILKIKKWWSLLAGKNGEAKAATMLEAFRQRLSLFRLGVLDSEDSAERLNATVSGIADILSHQMAQVAAVTDYPQTLLYGRSPAGQNATGFSDLELYYGVVSGKVQEGRLRGPLEDLYRLIARAPVWGGGSITNPLPQDIREQDPRVEFNPLWVPKESERAQVEQSRATTRNIYASLGWIDPDEGRKLLEQDGLIEPPDPDEFGELEEEIPVEPELNPLEPPYTVSAAVAGGVVRARRSGQSIPSWEESVARRLAGGRAITKSQAIQLSQILAEDNLSDEDEKLKKYFGGDITYNWLLGVLQSPEKSEL